METDRQRKAFLRSKVPVIFRGLPRFSADFSYPAGAAQGKGRYEMVINLILCSKFYIGFAELGPPQQRETRFSVSWCHPKPVSSKIVGGATS